jgi:hypothetical protein
MEVSTAETIVKIYAILAWLGALVMLIGAVALLVGGSFLGAFLPVGTNTAGFVGALSIGLAILLLIVAAFYVLVGFGLWTRRPWARIAVIIMSILDLFSFPVGTIIGVIGIWLFGFEDTVKGLFGGPVNYVTAPVAASRRVK